MVFERKHKIGVDEVNDKFEITNRALIVAFQNISSYQADSVNYGILNIPRTSLTWFVVDWKVEVLKRPKYGDEITIKSWGRNAYKCFAYKDFEVYANDILCVKATSKWVLYNVKNNSFENVTKKICELFGIDNNASVFKEKELKHMKKLNKYDEKNRIMIRKSDLDFNNHVNNVKYFDYLIDYSNATEYNNFRITYRNEIKPDEEVYLHYTKKDNKNYYTIMDNKNNVKTIIECE